MLRTVLVNLIPIALKFIRSPAPAESEIGWKPGSNTEIAVFICDNGVGFEMQYANKLFGVFQRQHHTDEFEETGIDRVNARHITSRQGGRAWAEGEIDHGANFYFSWPLPKMET